MTGHTPRLSFVIPTRNRGVELAETLRRLDGLGLGPDDAEVVVVDNASDEPALAVCALPTTLIRSEANHGAAGRNPGAQRARGGWIVMLDDDSSPMDAAGLLASLADAPNDAAAVMADIHLSGGRGRERGGLPEVFIGCGVAIRREAFLAVGGYDPTFGYYAEEYDLSAKLIKAGHRIVFDSRFRVEHRKAMSGRCMDTIIGRLVRNNGWVMQRHAPDLVRRQVLRADRSRYRQIARKEDALAGYTDGLGQLRATLRAQGRSPMSHEQFDRFTGLSHARAAIGHAHERLGFMTAAVVDAGKNSACIDVALRELGVAITDDAARAEVVVPGSMSPGPMIDSALAWASRGARMVCPWLSAEQFVAKRLRTAA